MLSQIDIKLTCIVDRCPVDDSITYNTGSVGGRNSARGVSTLCLINAVLVINFILSKICCCCLPRRLRLFGIKVFTSNFVDITSNCAESIGIIECAEDFTDFIDSANTRILQSASRDVYNRAISSSDACSIKLLKNCAFGQFYILIEGKLLDIINLLIQCITHVEFIDNIRFNQEFLTQR